MSEGLSPAERKQRVSRNLRGFIPNSKLKAIEMFNKNPHMEESSESDSTPEGSHRLTRLSLRSSARKSGRPGLRCKKEGLPSLIDEDSDYMVMGEGKENKWKSGEEEEDDQHSTTTSQSEGDDDKEEMDEEEPLKRTGGRYPTRRMAAVENEDEEEEEHTRTTRSRVTKGSSSLAQIDTNEKVEPVTPRTPKSTRPREQSTSQEKDVIEESEEIVEEIDEKDVSKVGASSPDDMYSRVKRTRRSSSRGVSYQNTSEEDIEFEEPIGRRLRERRGRISRDDDQIVSRNTEEGRSLRDRSKIRAQQFQYTPYNPRKSRGHRHSHSSARGSKSIDSILRRRVSLENKRRRRGRDGSDSSDDSSSSSDEEYTVDQKARKSKNSEKFKHKRDMQKELQPMVIDPSITFDSIGGLGNYINRMREIIFFPLIYKEFFQSRNMIPARGILFHGPPGCGKTLLARALANECSKIGNKKVSFFMRKGADVMNKWIGESERQLRMLFEQASLHQPSIIFFDEIDGLAPVRSAKTDQIHNSIVSTLLAEMDGLKDRGDVIVIGATNRVDSVDPALRRPGRFDHEFPFFLPTLEGRREIINVNVSKWSGAEVSPDILDIIADRTVGFSGADLRFLCSEAAMLGLRRRYPQIYKSTVKYQLDYDSIRVESEDWEGALRAISRSSDRSIYSVTCPGSPLLECLKPLFEPDLNSILSLITNIFPQNNDLLLAEPGPKRLLITSTIPENGMNEFILPAILHRMEGVPVLKLSAETLAIRDAIGDSAAITQIFAEAGRYNSSILLIPSMDHLWAVISEMGREILWRSLIASINKSILILATQSTVEDKIGDFFGDSRYTIEKPDEDKRRAFFEPVFKHHALLVKPPVVPQDQIEHEELPIAPPTPKKAPSSEEIAEIEAKEDRKFCELRVFLREIIEKLLKCSKFKDFRKPVDGNEVKDYYTVIKNPMDLETIWYKIDNKEYMSAGQFLEDITLIRFNAIEYNPAGSDEGKRIRSAANDLVDNANMLIDAEMNSDFEEECKGIIRAREERKNPKPELEGELNLPPLPKINPRPVKRLAPSTDSSTWSPTTRGVKKRGRKRKRGSNIWLGKKKAVKVEEEPLSGEKDPLPPAAAAETLKDPETLEPSKVSSTSSNSSKCGDEEALESENESEENLQNGAGNMIEDSNMGNEEYMASSESLLRKATQVSESFSIVEILDLRYQLLRAASKYYYISEKEQLFTEMEGILDGFAESRANSSNSSQQIDPLSLLDIGTPHTV